MTYRLSIEPNEVGSVAFFLLGVYDSEELARLDAMGLFRIMGDEVRTIAIKRFNGEDFVLEDVFDGQEWQSEIEAQIAEDYETHG